MKLPRTTAEQRRAMSAGRQYVGEFTMIGKNVYAKGQKTPVCSGKTMLELCERSWWRIVKKDPFVFRMTSVGFAVERELYAKYGGE